MQVHDPYGPLRHTVLWPATVLIYMGVMRVTRVTRIIRVIQVFRVIRVTLISSWTS